jgi:predicted small secreted protein
MKTSQRLLLTLVLVPALTMASCNVIKEIGQTMTNLSRCTFKLDSIGDFSLAGISLSSKTQLGVVDAAQALASFSRGELPASFTLNVAAQNPNTGSGGTTKTTATLTTFAWTLLIDNTQTISGDIARPIEIPGTGQQTVIPLRMSLDLVKFFKDRGYNNMINLALALGGANSSPSRVTLRARPTINTDFGPLTYPGDINIIDKEFRSQ